MNVTQPGQLEGGGFVGRDQELAVLRAALHGAAAGHGGLVLVAGLPGIGKTELVVTFGRYASGQGAMVLWGNAWEDGGAPPYWPWVQVLRSYGRQAGESALADAAGRDAAVLSHLLPELGVSPEPIGSGDGARFTLFEAVCGLLDRACQSAPLVIVLDDVHAAGHPSALLLRFAVARRLSRVLLIATYRDMEVRLDTDLSEVIGAMEGRGTTLTLQGLSTAEIRALLPGAAPGVLAAVQQRSEGNPLFVSQVARLLARRAGAVEEVAEVAVPAGIRHAIRRQVDRIADPAADHAAGPARRALTTADVLSTDIDPGLVAAVLGVPAESVSEIFDRAELAGLLRAGPVPGAPYRFAHALVRETLYGELTPLGRAESHVSVAAILNSTPWRGRTTNALLAYHFLRAIPAGRAEAAAMAVEFAALAGQDALDALAYEEAAGHFESALDALGRTADAAPTRRCELLLRHAEALAKSGRGPRAACVLDEALQLARQAGAARLLAGAALLRAQHLDFNAPDDAVVALLREAAAALEPSDPALRACTLARLAVALSSDPAAARATSAQAVEIARLSGDPAALAAALGARQHVLWGAQGPREALAGATEIVAAARAARDPEGELDGHVLRLAHLLELGDGPGAHRALADVDRLAGLLRQPLARLVASSRRSTLAALAGDFPEAARMARQAWEVGVGASLPDAGAVYWGQLFAVWLEAGLPEHDEKWMEQELRGLVARSRLSVAHACALVLIDAAHGARDQARGRFEELATTGLASLRPDMVYVWALALLARACVELGASHHAQPIYRALAPYAGRVAVAAGAVMCAGSVDRYLAGLAAQSGDADAAEGHFLAAVACHRRLQAQPLLARTLQEYAQLLRERARGTDLDRARQALAEAGAISAGCGMTRLQALLDQPKMPIPATLTLIREGGTKVHGVGKVPDIFAGCDIDESYPTKSNVEGITQTEKLLRELDEGFVFTNLVETDMLWGHRNDPVNFHRCLQDFDRRLPDLLDALRESDLLILTSDHGCDPTTPSTDHSREYALLLAYVQGKNAAGRLHEGEFADVGATVSAWVGGKGPARGLPGQPILER